jgi:hypothetical protein
MNNPLPEPASSRQPFASKPADSAPETIPASLYSAGAGWESSLAFSSMPAQLGETDAFFAGFASSWPEEQVFQNSDIPG